MPTVYVVHQTPALAVPVQELLLELPSNGYDCWLSSHHLANSAADQQVLAMQRCHAILVVLSSAALEPAAVQEMTAALDSQVPLLAIQTLPLTEQQIASLPARLMTLPKVDLTLETPAQAALTLISLLPPIESPPLTELATKAYRRQHAMEPDHAERIAWSEEIFSAALAAATSHHDRSRAVSLVWAMVRHLTVRTSPYPDEHAYRDLQQLRQEREFELMLRYGEEMLASTVLGSGTLHDSVRRLFGQALIETRQYERALQVLQMIICSPNSSRKETFEAHGLIGRVFKQRYIDSPRAPDAPQWLAEAICAYQTVYAQDSGQFWHGVNAASCMLRAERDGLNIAQRAQEIAQQILAALEQQERSKPLELWDRASRIEALLALGRYEDAARALDAYIHHPQLRAFEVFSTFRQFDQVLQLDRHPSGRVILTRLRIAMERHRSGPLLAPVPPSRQTDSETADEPKALVVRVNNPSWQPPDISGLKIQARMGKILTALGTQAAVRALLADPQVTRVEASHRAGGSECDRSIPFVKVAANYASASGNYDERGSHALVAIIDDGVDVLHEAFRDAAGNSRILGIWDQTATGTAPPGFDYGVFHSAADIAQYLQQNFVPTSLGRNSTEHGTHVASIAAGRATGDFAGGVAPEALLLIVVSAEQGPIGYSKTHIDALTFIDAFAKQRNVPVVVNLSQGMNAGAHDGKSSLEVAFDQFTESGRRPGRVIVKSAGNERDKKGHAEVGIPPEGKETLAWQRVAGADYAERIELWWCTGEVRFRLRDPSGEHWSNWVETAAPLVEGTFPNGGPYRLDLTVCHLDNGENLLVVELGTVQTAAAKGEWRLEMEVPAHVRTKVEIHAWIERTRGQPSAFLRHVSEKGTLSIPATATSVIAVGAVQARKPIEVMESSSYGPTRGQLHKPQICAPGFQVRAALSGTANAVSTRSGTSMAAPHVSGAIALLLSRRAKSGRMLNSNQIAATLRQKTQNYTGSWDEGQGYGVIDVSALLAAFS